MPPALTTLFEDLVSVSEIANDHAQRTAANNVLSFMYFSGHDVTILVSKNAGELIGNTRQVSSRFSRRLPWLPATLI